MPFIVDVSAAMAWCFEQEATEASDALWTRANGEGLLVPVHWRIEVANTILFGEKRRRITGAQADEFLWVLDMLRIEVDMLGASQVWPAVLNLARELSLTVYDAAYLDLALRTKLPLATRDKALIAAATTRGVVVIPS